MLAVIKINAWIPRSDSNLNVARVDIRVAVCVNIYPRIKSRQYAYGYHDGHSKDLPAHRLNVIAEYPEDTLHLIPLRKISV
jgi:hypothetical protein